MTSVAAAVAAETAAALVVGAAFAEQQSVHRQRADDEPEPVVELSGREPCNEVVHPRPFVAGPGLTPPWGERMDGRGPGSPEGCR
jgi:hypothetical protein